jgi:hypothetical protein
MQVSEIQSGGLMQIMEGVFIPQMAIYLMGILGLLILWQYHHIQTLSGRIYAVDFWDVSGIRMFMHATATDGNACKACREANGKVFLPSLATRKDFSTIHGPCTSPEGCRCLIVGMYGGWPEASRLFHYLRRHSKKKPFKLGGKELIELFEGPWQRGISASTDRLTINMIEALRLEGRDAEGAIVRYRYIIDQASGARDLRLVVPAYLRLSEMLERLNRHEEAFEIIQRFEKRFSRKRQIFYYPSELQRETMAIRRSNLVLRLRKQPPGPPAAPPRPDSVQLTSTS